jgi:SAM-dependent methyltransferase
MDAQYAAAYPELYRHHWWWRAREDILLQRIRTLLAAKPSARILDVGCGAALFFDALEPFGHVEGIESDRASVERSGKWRSRVTVGELDAAYHPSAPFDLILMLDVLEHIPDPRPALRRAGEILAPGGRILITVPAFNWLWTTHDEVNHHVTRYSAATMGRVIGQAGLATLETTYLFQSLVLPKLFVRAREAFASSPPSIPPIPAPAINRTVRAWFRAEHAVAGWLPFGTSLLVVAGAPAFAARP